MLVTTVAVKTPAVEHLLGKWEKRYKPDLSSVLLDDGSSDYASWLTTASVEGRDATIAKLKDTVLNSKCQMASIQAKSLYSYIPNVLDLSEARQITQFAYRVYKKVLSIYQQRLVSVTPQTALLSILTPKQASSLEFLGIPPLNQLAYALEPVLMVFQEQHVVSKDWRALGFMTTQLNFTNKLILRKLTPIEQALLKPYLLFVEEQVAIPWQRVCAAGAKHDLGSPALALVAQMLPIADEISDSVYRRLLELLPKSRSRRGLLSAEAIVHSSKRDLNMFQAYLWLCVLQQSVVPIEQELLSLCVMVMEAVEIPWQLTEKWIQVLTGELLSRITFEQQTILRPYTQAMEQVFFGQRHQLGYKGIK